MTEDEKVQAIKDAWTDAGPVPEYHEKFKRFLRVEWPTLAGAIDNLTGETPE